MTDPSIDPSLHPSGGLHHVHVSDIPQINSLDDLRGGPLPSEYFQTAHLYSHPPTAAVGGETSIIKPEEGRKRTTRAKRQGPLVRKRSGWNAFYNKEQFAIYHANNPPAAKANARERTGFSAYAAEMWKALKPEERQAYVVKASEDDALAVTRPVERLRRKRAGLLDTLGRIVAELESEFGVESLVFWAEKDAPPQFAPNEPPQPDGEAFGAISSATGSIYSEHLSAAQLGPPVFASIIQQHHAQSDDDPNNPIQQLTGINLPPPRKRRRGSQDETILDSQGNPISSGLPKKAKSNISRDYHDAEFRRLLLTLLNSHLPPANQKTRLPRGFFGPYLEKHGMELIGLPEKPVEIGEGGKIGGWSADALRKNLEAVRSGNVRIVKIGEVPLEQHQHQQHQHQHQHQHQQELSEGYDPISAYTGETVQFGDVQAYLREHGYGAVEQHSGLEMNKEEGHRAEDEEAARILLAQGAGAGERRSGRGRK